MVDLRRASIAVFALILVPVGLDGCEGERIRALLTGQVDELSNPLLKWFGEEPLVDARSVPSRPGGLVNTPDIERFIRIYFPRKYDEVRSYDFIMLHSPVLYYFSDTQIRWLYDSYREGAGGLEAPSCMSASSDIYAPWVSSVLQEAFPSDSPSVIASGGPKGSETFRIIVNMNIPEPVLKPFVPLGIEGFVGAYAYYIIPRAGASVVAWELGCFPERVPYMVAWDYERGRTMTLGDSFGLAFWSSYAARTSQNPYSLDILMNMVLYLTKREVTTDVIVFHRMRTSFLDFRARMSLLLSLVEFVERFGASDRRIDGVISSLEGLVRSAEDQYLHGDFTGCEETMASAVEEFRDGEKMMLRLKERALLWVYVIEWLIAAATTMVSGFILWTLMVRRLLYRQMGSTRLGQIEEGSGQRILEVLLTLTWSCLADRRLRMR